MRKTFWDIPSGAYPAHLLVIEHVLPNRLNAFIASVNLCCDFRPFEAEFLQRCEGDVHFSCKEGDIIAAAIDTAMQTGERVNVGLNVTATVPTKLGNEPAGKFKLTISIKKSKG